MTTEIFHTELIRLVAAAGLVELPRLVGLQGVVETPCGELAEVTITAVDVQRATYDLRRNTSGRTATRSFSAENAPENLVWDIPEGLHAELQERARRRAEMAAAQALYEMIALGRPHVNVATVVEQLQRLHGYTKTESARSREFLRDISHQLAKRTLAHPSRRQAAWLIDIARRVSLSALAANGLARTVT